MTTPTHQAPVPAVGCDAVADRADSAGEVAIYLGGVRRTVRNAVVLLTETVLVPTVLLFLFVDHNHPMIGVIAVFVWRASCVLARTAYRRAIPGTVWMTFGMFCVRSISSLVFASVAVYLWQPVTMSALLGLAFVLTAFSAQPLTMRLAGDFLHLSDEARRHRLLRRTFSEVALIWGGVHVLSAAAGAYSMRLPTQTTVAIHGALGLACTLLSVGGCIVWGLYRIAKMRDVRLHLGVPNSAGFGEEVASARA